MGLFSSKNKELEKLRTENEELKTKFHLMFEKEQNNTRLEDILKLRRREVANVHNEKKRLLISIEEIKSEEELKREQLNDLKKRISDLSEMKEELQTTLLSYSGQINELQAQDSLNINAGINPSMQKHILEFEEKKMLLLIEEKEIEGRLNDLKNKVKRLTGKENELTEKERFLRLELIEIENRRSDLLLENSEFAEKIRESEQKLYQLKKDEAKLAQFIKEKNNALNEINSQLKNLSGESKNNFANVERLINEQKQLSDRVSHLQKEEARLKDAIPEQESKLADLQLEEQKIKIRYEDSYADITSLKKEEKEIMHKIAALHDVEMQLKQANNNNGKMSDELNVLVREKDGMKEIVNNLRNKIENQNDNLKSLLKEEEKIRYLINNGLNTIKENNSRIDQLKNEIGTIQINIEDLRREESERIQQNLFLKDEHNNLKNSIEAENEKLNKLREAYGQHHKEIDFENNEQTEEIKNEYQKILENIALLKTVEKRLKEGNSSLHEEELRLNEKLTAEKNRINELSQDINILNGERIDIQKQLQILQSNQSLFSGTISNLKEEEERLKEFMSSENFEVREISGRLNALIDEKKAAEEKVEEAKKYFEELTLKANLIKNEENEKKDYLHLLNNRIVETENLERNLLEKLSVLQLNIDEKYKLYEQVNSDYIKLTDETSFKQKELYSVDQSLALKSDRLNKLNIDMIEMEKKIENAKQEIGKHEAIKNDVRRKIVIEKENAGKQIEQYNKLQELLPLLDQRRKEIEQGNSDLEARFVKMFQRFNGELNEINRKRNALEQVILQKENDIDEKDQALFEKIAALEESERVLQMRQAEIDAVEQMLSTIDEQKDRIRNELMKIDEESIDRKKINADLKLETELLFKKKISLEKGLNELLGMVNQSYAATKERKNKVESDLQEYEEQLQVCRDRINDSMKELVELQGALSEVKIEYQEYKGSVSKLSSLKRKLKEEISKHQSVLARYQKIREKLKHDPITSKIKEEDAYKKLEEHHKSGKDTDQKSAYIYNF